MAKKKIITTTVVVEEEDDEEYEDEEEDDNDDYDCCDCCCDTIGFAIVPLFITGILSLLGTVFPKVWLVISRALT